MKVIYRAESSIDAHLLKGLLEQAGLIAFVNGSFLQGGIGELPVNDLVTVSVIDDDAAAAEQIAKQFQHDLGAGRYAVREVPLPATAIRSTP